MSQAPAATMIDVQGVAAGVDQDDGSYQMETARLRVDGFVAELRGTQNAGTSLDAKLVDSFDGGLTWNDWVVFTQLTGDGSEVIQPTRGPGPLVKAVRTSVGNGWDYRIKLAFDHL